MLSGMLRVLIIALVLLVAAMFLLPRPAAHAPRPDVATLIEPPRPLPELTLTDQAGRPFRTADLEGGFQLLFFGFTNCPDVCPLTLAVLADVAARLGERYGDDAPGVVFVSVDPARDSPERIAAYLGSFDPDFTGVTGDDAALAPLLDMLGVSVHRQEVDGEAYNVVHNGHVYVIGPEADWRAVFRPSTDAAAIAADYARIYGAHARDLPFAPAGP